MISQNSNFWFSSLDRLGEIALGGVLLFALTVVLIRILGKRSTSQMNNFDWIVTVAAGSLLASGILLRDISYTDAGMAMIVLGACQWAMTKVFVAFPGIARLLRANPRVLTDKGQFLEGAMRKERITEDEILARLREKGMFDCSDANWVVLESDGRLSVLPRKAVEVENVPTMKDVQFQSEAVK